MSATPWTTPPQFGATQPQFGQTQPAPVYVPPSNVPVIPSEVIKRLAALNFPLNNDGVLMLWQASQKALVDAKDDEMELRKLNVALRFVKPDEGTNRVELGGGMDLKTVIKFNRTLVSPDPKKDVVNAVDDVIDAMAIADNEGSFIADQLFKWSVDISKTEYDALEVEASTSVTKKKLLDLVNTVLIVKDAAPTLEIVKAKKK